MIIQAFPCGPLSTNTFVVACPTTKLAAVIDPALSSTSLIVDYLKANTFTLQKIILTHSHWDHIADAAKLLAVFPVPIYVHDLDKANLENPGADGLPLMTPIKGVFGAQPLAEGGQVNVGDINFTIIHTPGHTPGGVCLYCAEEGILFSGDTLFRGTIGNLSLPTAVPYAMWGSLRKLAALPPDTKVYPGHGSPTTLRNEAWLANAEDLFG